MSEDERSDFDDFKSVLKSMFTALYKAAPFFNVGRKSMTAITLGEEHLRKLRVDALLEMATIYKFMGEGRAYWTTKQMSISKPELFKRAADYIHHGRHWYCCNAIDKFFHYYEHVTVRDCNIMFSRTFVDSPFWNMARWENNFAFHCEDYYRRLRVKALLEMATVYEILGDDESQWLKQDWGRIGSSYIFTNGNEWAYATEDEQLVYGFWSEEHAMHAFETYVANRPT